MLDANAGGSDSAVAIGGATDGAVAEHGAAVEGDAGAGQAQDTGASAAASGGAGAAVVSGDFASDQFPLHFQGKTIVPKTKEELVNWAQLGYNYNKRNVGLTEREKKIKEQEIQYGQIAQLSSLFDQNPAFKQAVYDVYHKFASSQGGQPADGTQPKGDAGQLDIQNHPYVRQLQDKIDKIEKGYQTWEKKQASESVEKEISSLKSTHKDEDWTSPNAETGETLEIEVLKHADKNGFRSLEAAYRDLRWDNMQTQVKAQALKDAEQQKLNDAKAGIVSKGGTAQASGQQKTIPRTATYDQIAQQAMLAMK
jgi:hypothetical protein